MQSRRRKTVSFKSPVIPISAPSPVLNEEFFKTLCNNVTIYAWAVNPKYFADNAILSELAVQNLVARFLPKLYLFNITLDAYKECFHPHLAGHETTTLGLDTLTDDTVMSIIDILPTKTRLTVLGVENISDNAIEKLVETLEGMARENFLIPMQYSKKISEVSQQKIEAYNLNINLQINLLKATSVSPASPTSSAKSISSSDSSNILSSTATIMNEMRVSNVSDVVGPNKRQKAEPVSLSPIYLPSDSDNLDPLPFDFWHDEMFQLPEPFDSRASKNTLRF
jgi:hypothetical protein